MKLKGKVAIITGSTSGMGVEDAMLFAKEGASVVITGRNEKRLKDVYARIKELSDDVLGVCADISTPEGTEKVFNDTMEAFGRVDILVNNAGVFDKYASLLNTDEDLWDMIYNIDIKATFRMCKLVLPQMIERESGSIVNIASIAGLVAGKGGAAYTSSKHAVIGLTKHMASEYARYGIKINAICPGTIVTPLIKEVADTIPKDNVPMRRFGKPEEVAELAVFLASDYARFVNGAIIPIDGGFTIQ